MLQEPAGLAPMILQFEFLRHTRLACDVGILGSSCHTWLELVYNASDFSYSRSSGIDSPGAPSAVGNLEPQRYARRSWSMNSDMHWSMQRYFGVDAAALCLYHFRRLG